MGCFPAACFKRRITLKKCQHCRCKNCPQNKPRLVNEASVLKLLTAAAIATDSHKEDHKFVNLDNLISELKQEGQIKSSDGMNGNSDSPTIVKHVDEGAAIMDDTLVGENTIQEVEEKYKKSIKESSLIPHGPHELSDSHQELLMSDEKCMGLDLKEISSGVEQEESYDSLFSLSIDSRRRVSTAAAKMEDREVMSPLKQQQPIETGEANSVGSKRYNEKILSSAFEDKENVDLEEKCIMPSSEKVAVFVDSSVEKCGKSKSLDNVSAVETSLSSWLVESLKSPHKTAGVANSPDSEKNYTDRRILGEVTPLQIKRSNEMSSPARSTPSCGTNGPATVGTVGSYWQQIGR